MMIYSCVFYCYGETFQTCHVPMYRCVIDRMSRNIAPALGLTMRERVESAYHVQQPQRADTRHLRCGQHRTSREGMCKTVAGYTLTGWPANHFSKSILPMRGSGPGTSD